MFKPSSREIPIEKQAATLLFIDVQNYNARRDGGNIGMSTSRTE
jgi:ureidoacrylate peracid hydrolase